jgi:hypothetical protein
LSLLRQPIREQLAELEEQLESRIAEVNGRIATRENAHFEFIRHGRHVRWTLGYPHESEGLNHPFFDRLKQLGISSILHFVNRQCRFMNAFEHVLGRYAKQEADNRILTACLTAWATNMGLGRMGEISDISFHTLVSASDNFIRPETLREANDRISNAIAKLPIFRHYDLGDALHSSSDGQKFETSIHTLNARHSPKYFGLKKGIVSYTLVANNIPINAYIIGANEHESHYVFDILFNNTTDIQPEILRPIRTVPMRSISPCCICSDTSSRPATRICTIKSALPWSASNTQANTVMQSSGPCERPRRNSSSANGTTSSALSCPWHSKPQPRAPSSAS